MKDDTVEIMVNNEVYKCWRVEYIKPYIIKFLKQEFPKSLITYETDKIDVLVMNDVLIVPVEIQKTSMGRKDGKYSFRHAAFEDFIRRQIEDNINNSDICWFFFDHEYFRYLKLGFGNLSKSTSINMNWMVEYLKNNKLKVFTIRYDGYVKELTVRDFEFLKNISQTCPLGYDTDSRILNRNKTKIFRDVLVGYNFNQKELDDIYAFVIKNNDGQDKDFTLNFLLKQENKRFKLFGTILQSISNLESINAILDMQKEKHRMGKYAAKIIGIFDLQGIGGGVVTKVIDKFDVCKYFPGYLRNKEKWDYLKECNMKLNNDQFNAIITGRVNPLDWKKLFHVGW